MKQIILLMMISVVMLGCTKPLQPAPLQDFDSGLIEVPEAGEEAGQKETVEEMPEKTQEVPEEANAGNETEDKAEEKIRKQEYNHPQIEEILSHIRWRMGFAKAHVNPKVCTVYKYGLEHLKPRRADEVFGISCPRTFLFFGYGRTGLFTFDVQRLPEYFAPKEPTEEGVKKSLEEFKYLVNEAQRWE